MCLAWTVFIAATCYFVYDLHVFIVSYPFRYQNVILYWPKSEKFYIFRNLNISKRCTIHKIYKNTLIISPHTSPTSPTTQLEIYRMIICICTGVTFFIGSGTRLFLMTSAWFYIITGTCIFVDIFEGPAVIKMLYNNVCLTWQCQCQALNYKYQERRINQMLSELLPFLGLVPVLFTLILYVAIEFFG